MPGWRRSPRAAGPDLAVGASPSGEESAPVLMLPSLPVLALGRGEAILFPLLLFFFCARGLYQTL